MPERGCLKSDAKNAIRASGYWNSFVVCLLVLVFVEGEVLFTQSISGYARGWIGRAVKTGLPWPDVVVRYAIFLLLIAYLILIGEPLRVGQARYFMKHRSMRPAVGTLIWPFEKDSKNIRSTLFFMNLKIALGYFLLIAPGIIQTYEYYFVPYILAENPRISRTRAFAISSEMTQEKKAKIFVLQLSFLGWRALSLILVYIIAELIYSSAVMRMASGGLMLGSGLLLRIIFMPAVPVYVEGTNAELYAAFREDALKYGYATQEELPGFEEEEAA